MVSKLFIKTLTVFTFLFITYFSQAADLNTGSSAKTEITEEVLTVYKNPSCGCCEKWVTHVEKSGFETVIHDRNDLSGFKSAKGIESEYRSCHTAVSKNGYVFEGHVPAKHIQNFLAEKPENVLGLSAPGMGMGSPGMEMGGKFKPYKVLLLKKDGSSEVYASINSYKEQF
tara:strand:+ start:11677 stop:12189 length:513 start_codon:yes stop_codon:yes gene_type:complete